MLRSNEEPATRLQLLFDMDRILGFGLKAYLQSEEPRKKSEPETYLAALPATLANEVRAREALRHQSDYGRADRVRQFVQHDGYQVRDTTRGPLVLPRPLEEEFPV